MTKQKTQTDPLIEVHQTALRRFNDIQMVYQDERDQCLQDRRFAFIPGAQWEGGLQEQFANKPKFEVNKINNAITRVFNDYRSNKMVVKFSPRNIKSVPDQILADSLADLLRADEYDSDSDEAYDNAFDEGSTGGLGAWLVTEDYEDQEDLEDEKQRIRFEPIFDADSCVFWGPSKKYDKSDASYAFLITGSMSKQDYELEYGDRPDSWPKPVDQSVYDWSVGDEVYLANYYVKETKKTTYIYYKDLLGNESRYSEEEIKENPELVEDMADVGTIEVRRRKLSISKIRKYIMSGGRVLEDCGYIAGKHIPIIPYYAKRMIIDGVERAIGKVRYVKDVSRLKNMEISQLAEISATTPLEKPIVTPEEIQGHKDMWVNDNIQNNAYLMLNAMKDKEGNPLPNGPLRYTKPATVPPALAALLQVTENDMQDVLGAREKGDKVLSNVSEKTVNAIHDRIDSQSYLNITNFEKSLKRSAEVWLSKAKELYDEKNRVMRGVGQEKEIREVVINTKGVDSNQVTFDKNIISSAKHDVFIETGPSTSTKRKSIIDSATNVLEKTRDPQTASILEGIIMMNMEGEGLIDVRKFFRKRLVEVGAIEPTEEEKQEILESQQNQEPTAQDVYLRAAAQKEITEAEENQANTILKQAQADGERADTAKTLSELRQGQIETAVKVVKEMGPSVTPQTLNQNPLN